MPKERSRQSRTPQSVAVSAPTSTAGSTGANERPRITLCVIARDEAENLAALLEDMRGRVDEIVVVDTGSRDDRTLEVAARYGARTGRHQWQDDFAAARNAALDLATGDWVLSLDADERFTEAVPNSMRVLVEQTGKPTDDQVDFRCFLPQLVHSEQVEQGRKFVSYVPRLFPRHRLMRWINPLYETVGVLPGARSLDLAETPALTVTHLGHPGNPARLAEKRARNLRIVEKALRESPGETFTHVAAGREYLLQRNYAAAAEQFMRADQMVGGPPVPSFMENAYVNLVTALTELGEPDKAVEYGLKGLQTFPVAELDCVLAVAYLVRGGPGDQDQALRHFQRARNLHSFGGSRMGAQEALTWKPLSGMGHIYELRGQWDRAYTCYEDALRYAPDDPTIRRQMASVLRQLGRPAEAAQHLRHVLSASPAGVTAQTEREIHLELAGSLAESGDAQAAYDLLSGLVSRHPDVVAYRLQLAELLIKEREFEAAIETLSPALDSDAPASVGVYRHLGEALAQLGRYEDAINAYQIALNLDPSDKASQQRLETAERLAAGTAAV